MKVGYVRISTAEQNTARQEEIMKQLGVEKVFIDKISGKDTNRPGLNQMMAYVREGDCIVVESISRFARNVNDLLDLIETLSKKQVDFVSQKEAINTKEPAGRFMLTVFGAVSELERDYIKIRQREGIDIAIAEGRFTGRPKKAVETFYDVYTQWKEGKITATRASKLLEISRSTFYRKVKENESEEIIDF